MWSQILLAVILAGAIHGFISSGLLLRTAATSKSNFYLGVLMVLIALSNLNIFLLYQPLSPRWQVLGDVLPLVMYMPVGPLLYAYTRARLYPDRPLSPKFRMHFIPVVLDLLPYIVALLLHLGVLANGDAVGRFVDRYNIFVDLPRWISISVYLGLCWKIYRQAKGSLDIAKIAKGIRSILIAFAAFQSVWFIFLLIYLMPQYEEALLQSAGWFPLYIPLSALIYWIGIQGYRSAAPDGKAPEIPGEVPVTMPVFIPDEKTDGIATRLKQVMEEDHLYLNPGLNLALMSEHTGLPPKVISSVLNQYLHISFNEFINGYRVQAFRQKVISEDMQQYTIAGMAQQCGFNSLATFQRVFRQVTGMSPSEFLKSSPA